MLLIVDIPDKCDSFFEGILDEDIVGILGYGDYLRFAKVVPLNMRKIIKSILEKYEYAQNQTYIKNEEVWAVTQVCKELRGDL